MQINSINGSEKHKPSLTENDLLKWCDRLDEQAEYIKQVSNQIRIGILYGDSKRSQVTDYFTGGLDG